MKTHLARKKSARQFVQFELLAPNADGVWLAGTFNDWHPGSLPLKNRGDGLWRLAIELPPGRYEYALVVDGHWILDPRCSERVENPFGGLNSVLVVQPPVGEPRGPAEARERCHAG